MHVEMASVQNSVFFRATAEEEYSLLWATQTSRKMVLYRPCRSFTLIVKLELITKQGLFHSAELLKLGPDLLVTLIAGGPSLAVLELVAEPFDICSISSTT